MMLVLSCFCQVVIWNVQLYKGADGSKEEKKAAPMVALLFLDATTTTCYGTAAIDLYG